MKIFKSDRFTGFLQNNWLLLYYILIILYFELLYGLWTNKNIGPDFIFPFLFSLTAGAVFYLVSRMFGRKANFVISLAIMVFTIFIYLVYLIYFDIFKVPLYLFSIIGAKDAFQFDEVIIESIRGNLMAIFLFLIPIVPLVFLRKLYPFGRIEKKQLYATVIFILVSFLVSLAAVSTTKDKQNSQYMLYYKVASPQLSVSKLGLLTTIRLDLQRLVTNFEDEGVQDDEEETEPSQTTQAEQTTQTETTAESEASQTTAAAETETEETTVPATTEYVTQYNMIDIDFDSLIENEQDPVIADMHKYFASQEPTEKNEYTGIFEGDNLIFIVAESLFPYAISKELTPTLYMMANEGFIFKNFYNPIFGVSTSDGEYVACLGLLPKTGVWSFYVSGRNYLPFAFGNQFRDIGYTTMAYHNHTYTYYNRHISHPNMGYEYKGVGNGLDIAVTWPESDLEMIEVTTGEYITGKPFHVYYLTVSGHLQYNFGGNRMAEKNRSLVEDLPYSNQAKAYIACNIEFDRAMEELIKRLDEAGELEKTVIAITPDHYPYGLSRDTINELVGHEVEGNFELYKGLFILWKAGMGKILVPELCSSLDINPTISNLFGLEYDSRLLMGHDVFSDVPPLIIFANRSWITDKARYNSITDKVVFYDEDDYDPEYVKEIHNIVMRMFKYSTRILENDYYGVLREYLGRAAQDE